MNVDRTRQGTNTPHGDSAAMAEEILQFATFYLNGELLGLNILQVQEIQRPQAITPVPLAPKQIMGLISLRGQTLPLIDLRTRLGMDTSEPIKTPYHIVVNIRNTIACVEVDQIGDVIDVPAEKFEPPPDSVHSVDAQFLEGVFPLKDKILSVLNVERILETN